MSESSGYSLRNLIGACMFDLPKFLFVPFRMDDWVYVHNRNDRMERNPDGRGISIIGQWSSDLHACHVFSWLGAMLLRRALLEWPVLFQEQLSEYEQPEVSFIIPHRGVERLPLLIATIKSIAAQQHVKVECIVVEQNQNREIEQLPLGTKYIHLPDPEGNEGWKKSWAYNIGVKHARSDIVVCHDGDILVPNGYAEEIVKVMREKKVDVAHLQRFLFCLTRDDSNRLLENESAATNCVPERIRQNWQGGTLAIRKEAFFRVGGYDEQFVGWGGEDNEFYDRCLTLKGWRYGYLPFVHLWHAPQKEKVSPERDANLKLLRDRLSISASQRIQELGQRV